LKANSLQALVEQFISEYRGGSLTSWWRKPLVGVAEAQDPLFRVLKRKHGFLLPEEIVNSARSVVVIFLPFAEWIVESNLNPGPASREWALAYLEANQLLTNLADWLAETLEMKGFKSKPIAPTGEFDEEALISNWSHKHAAYVAGLGSLGVHHMLITEEGCCGRLVSIVTEALLNHRTEPLEEACLHKLGFECLKCVAHCQFGALTATKLNKQKCYEVCLSNAKLYIDLGLADVCGKCACGLPCSLKKPTADIERKLFYS